MGIVSRVAETEDQRAGDVEAARDLDQAGSKERILSHRKISLIYL